MTTTRDRLHRRSRRRTRVRVAVIVSVSVLVVLAVAAAFALWWLPPVLAQTPRERFITDTRISLHDDDGAASVAVGTGWLAIGVGPFLPSDAATLISPDDVYHAEFDLVPAGRPFDGNALLVELGLIDPPAGATDAPAPPGSDAATTPPAATDASTPAAQADPAAPEGDVRSRPIIWNTETLATGVVVHHMSYTTGLDTVTVALAEPVQRVAGAGSALTLVATVPTDVAPQYRTVTADLLASARFTPAEAVTETPAAAPATIGPQAAAPAQTAASALNAASVQTAASAKTFAPAQNAAATRSTATSPMPSAATPPTRSGAATPAQRRMVGADR